MKRNLIAVLTVSFVAGLFAAPAAYGAQQYLQGAINGWNKAGKVLEVRRCLDGSYDMLLLKEDEFVMYKFRKGQTIVMTPLRTYDVEKAKAIGGGAGRGLATYMNSQNAQKVNAQIFVVTINMGEDGAYEYLVHAFHPVGQAYRKTWVVPTTTWEMKATAIQLDEDPRTNFWSKEEQEAGSVDFDAVAAVKPPMGEAGPEVEEEAIEEE